MNQSSNRLALLKVGHCLLLDFGCIGGRGTLALARARYLFNFYCHPFTFNYNIDKISISVENADRE